MKIITQEQQKLGPSLLRCFVIGAIPLLLAASTMAGIVPYAGEGTPVIGASVVVATTGDVMATFLAGSGSYSDFLYLDNPGSSFANGGSGVTGNWIFENHLNHGGDTVDLGTWTAGTVLQFQIVADTTGTDWAKGTTGTKDGSAVYNWFTGPASLNSDGKAHAWVDDTYTGPYGGTAVGFEDLPGLGDAGYEDLRYTFSNVRASTTIPEISSTFALLSASLTGLALFARRLKK